LTTLTLCFLAIASHAQTVKKAETQNDEAKLEIAIKKVGLNPEQASKIRESIKVSEKNTKRLKIILH
jgi:hypothetical protein